MKNKNTSGKRRKHRIKGSVIILLISVLIFAPLVSSAAQDNSKVNYSHGTLNVSAGDIIIPLPSKITKDEIIKLADPSATHTYNSGGVTDQPVEASYSVSEDDIKRLNDSMENGNEIMITIHGTYMYYCSICQDDQPVTGSTDIKVSFVRTYNYKVTFKANGGKIDGRSQKVVTVSSINTDEALISKDLMPKVMEKKNSTFKGWSKSSQRYIEFTASTPIKGDTTVYAHWALRENKDDKKNEKTGNKNKDGDTNKKVSAFSEDKAIKHVTTETKNYQISRADFTNGDGDGNNNGGENSGYSNQSYINAVEFASMAESQDIPVTQIGKGNVPLYAPEGSSGWAFINLLLTAMAILMMLVSMIIGIRQGRNKRTIWFVLPIICSIAAAVLFLITENIRLNMVMIDGWTVLSAILFAVTVISTIAFLKKEEDFEDYIFKY